MSERRIYRPGDTVKTAGVYKSAGGRRVGLSIGEAFPATTQGTGWTLDQRMAIERNPQLVQPTRPTATPIVIDPAAMEYAIDKSYLVGWNGALTALEARILANGKGSKAHFLETIAELRIRRTIAGTTVEDEGDPEDG